LYIKLDESMNLVITVNEPIYRGDNLNRKIIYLIPLTVGEIDILTANVYLSYIRSDGVADVVILERMAEKYKESYFQYTLPVTCKLTKYPGEVCTWIQIYTGTPSNPTVSKSGECALYINESKSMDAYLEDNQMTALYQIHKAMEQGLTGVDEDITKISEDIAKKADGLIYDAETRALQLKSGDAVIGDAVTVPSDEYSEDIADEVEDTWSDMTDADETDGNEAWEPM